MSEELQGLLAVQDLDIGLDQLRHRRDHLPERTEMEVVDRTVSELEAELVGLNEERERLGRQQAAAETELAATESRVAAIDRRLYGGDVAAARDLQAMTAEVAHLKERASDLEDTVLAVMGEIEPLDERAGELRRRLDELVSRRAVLVESLARSVASLDADAAERVAQRQAAAAAVDESLLATYEKLRSRLGGIGVARLVGNHCDGCHLTLSAVELDQVRHLGEGQIYTCEQCSRILVP
ncbi:MAG: hypothetical protein KGQ66_18740 [Acidobacteriota bacterium]|nr:hypothetical protein [Acidobacteriota bacterium]